MRGNKQVFFNDIRSHLRAYGWGRYSRSLFRKM